MVPTVIASTISASRLRDSRLTFDLIIKIVQYSSLHPHRLNMFFALILPPVKHTNKYLITKHWFRTFAYFFIF